MVRPLTDVRALSIPPSDEHSPCEVRVTKGVVGKVFQPGEVREAIRYLESGQAQGRLIVKVEA